MALNEDSQLIRFFLERISPKDYSGTARAQAHSQSAGDCIFVRSPATPQAFENPIHARAAFLQFAKETDPGSDLPLWVDEIGDVKDADRLRKAWRKKRLQRATDRNPRKRAYY